ncbi:GTP cyclohydrolase, FolE2/MptA family, partial [Campylobacter fetus subsp. venerealis]
MPKSHAAHEMVDIQNTPDERNIAIDKVGVRNVRYPIRVRERDNG